ncbi:Sodium/hydrogen exchanger 8 [Saguinus oedipus]|uniref:Sodium/hydrogen exchanger 8 n=1 Tax=Saguinus oedipus TaxID=9490 RepID=A0ABQ9VNI8_SAGOE|nr:Sodium/hydrogen exchanger 8 [Saguinus oedipus]
MAILFSGIVMSHYTHHNLSPVTQILMQQTLRTVAFLCGLRGAIPYALSLHLDLEPMEKRQLIGTTTIIIVLFTILLLGGSTMPLIRLMDIEDAKARRRNKKDVNLSKTEKMHLLKTTCWGPEVGRMACSACEGPARGTLPQGQTWCGAGGPQAPAVGRTEALRPAHLFYLQATAPAPGCFHPVFILRTPVRSQAL